MRVIGQIKSTTGRVIAAIVLFVALAATIVAVRQEGYHAGAKEGFEAGRFAEHEYVGGKGIADSCYEWAALYDKAKPGNTEHVEKSCDGMMATARSWVNDKPMEGMAGIY